MVIELCFVEIVKINNEEIKARIDTGARRCSIDRELAKKIGLGPVVGQRRYRSAHGKSSRPVVQGDILIKGKNVPVLINLADRSHMQYPLLIGREALKEGFIINPNKK
tara:strand:+ start:390 stop:713 length:324 start_codon:yes stop_codon:yes gene_type:complete